MCQHLQLLSSKLKCVSFECLNQNCHCENIQPMMCDFEYTIEIKLVLVSYIIMKFCSEVPRRCTTPLHITHNEPGAFFYDDNLRTLSFVFIFVMKNVVFFWCLQIVPTKASVVSKRVASKMPVDHVEFTQYNQIHGWINSTKTNATSTTVFEKQTMLHRVARQVTEQGQEAGPVAGESQVYTSDSFNPEFLHYDWSHPFLIANVFYSVAAVIALLRMLPYVVVSDVIGPLQISIGSMLSHTAHFFLVVAVVLFSFAVGLTHIYSYYEETTLLTCNEADDTCQRGYFGK